MVGSGIHGFFLWTEVEILKRPQVTPISTVCEIPTQPTSPWDHRELVLPKRDFGLD